jgi:hypothetical protein
MPELVGQSVVARHHRVVVLPRAVIAERACRYARALDCEVSKALWPAQNPVLREPKVPVRDRTESVSVPFRLSMCALTESVSVPPYREFPAPLDCS